jgi:catechol 2,3-dioxygenase-like lactoylglutathione lyase family enzyme
MSEPASRVVQAVPLLRVTWMGRALDFYRGKLGFVVRSEYRGDPERADPAYVVLGHGDIHIHLSSFPGDGQTGARLMVFVRNIDDLHADLRARGVEIELEPTDQTWGNREMYVFDPDANQLRFTQPVG